MKQLSVLSNISLAIFWVLVIYFVYLGITTSIQGVFEGDSLAYHIPIARELSKFNFLPPNIPMGLGYYPAVGEAILAIFIILHVPINLFGVLALLLLFVIAKKVAESLGISKDFAVVYAVTLSTLPSVLRWPLTQVVDVWVLIFFLAVFYYLLNPLKTAKYYFLLGAAAGALTGSKFTGPIFLVILFLFFGKDVIGNLKLKTFIYFIVPFIVLGLSFYIRNFVITGNPFYPANFLFLKGVVNLQNWNLASKILRDPAFIFKFIESWFSEYFVWGVTALISIYIYFSKTSGILLKKLSLAALLIFIVFLFFPPAEPILSNMRYLYPAAALMILQTFIFFKDKKPTQLVSVSILATTFSLTNLNYLPKMFIVAILAVAYFLFK